jgi:hypothetical protein
MDPRQSEVIGVVSQNPVFRALGLGIGHSSALIRPILWPRPGLLQRSHPRMKGSLVHPAEGPAPAGLVKEVERGVERGTGSF